MDDTFIIVELTYLDPVCSHSSASHVMRTVYSTLSEAEKGAAKRAKELRKVNNGKSFFKASYYSVNEKCAVFIKSDERI